MFTDGSSNNFPPINFLTEDGEITGFGHDLAKAVIEATGGTLRSFHSSRWVEVTSALDSGAIDFIHDTGYTPDREKFFDYTQTILAMNEVIFVRQGQVDITSFDNLAGRDVACVRKHITHLYLMKFPEIRCKIVETPLHGLTALINGDVDAYIYPEQIVHYYAQKLRLTDRIKIVGDPLRTLTWGMTVKKGNAAMLERLNQGISLVRESGEYQKIYDRYFGRRILSGYSPKEVGVIAGALSILSLLVGGVLILAAFLWRVKKAEDQVRQLNAELEGRVKERTAELTAEQHFISTVLETQQALVVVMNHHGEVVRFNRACETLTGFHRDEVLGRHVWEMLIPAGQVEEVRMVFNQLTSGMFPNTHENEWVTRDGGRRLIAWANSAIADDGGGVAYVIGTGIDITENKRLEGELLRNERLATLGQLTATVSHELRNPLNVISNSSHSVAKMLAGSPVDASRPLERIVRNVDRCTTIIDDMLEYTRMKTPDIQQLDFDKWLKQTVQSFTLPEGVQIESQLGTNGAIVGFDPERMRQVVINLLDNAIQAMEENGGKKLFVRTTLTDSGLRLEIEDTGPGLNDGVQSKIFEPLFSTKTFGVGLGMPIVRNIVQSHGGTVAITNSPNTHGALVSVEFPQTIS